MTAIYIGCAVIALGAVAIIVASRLTDRRSK